MRLYYGGGEIPAWRKLLQNEGVNYIALSYVGLSRRNLSLKGMFDPSWHVFLDSGGYTYNKRQEEFKFEDVLEFAAKYMDFVKANIDYVSLVSEFDAQQLGTDFIRKFREDFYDSLPPEKFMPIWHEQDGKEALEDLCSTYQVVGVSQNDIHGDTTSVPFFNSLVSRYKVKLHGVGITSKKLLESVRWDSVSSTSWLSPSKYGETFVWFGGKDLRRFPKDYKDRRRSNASYLTSRGFNAEKIIAGDTDEILRLSLWSWQNYISVLSGVTPMTGNETSEIAEMTPEEVDTLKEKNGTVVVKQRDVQALPIMRTVFSDVDPDDEEAEPQAFLTIRSESMRVCDSCFIKDRCPGFQANSTCLYNIPLEIRTKDQLRALHDSLIEIQSQRVLFMKMAEDLGGGYADPNLSSEIDRLNRMIKTKVEGDKNTFSATLNISETPQGPSIMEKMFGSSAAGKLKELDAPVNPDDIIEAEIVE